MRFLKWIVSCLDRPRAGYVVIGIALVLATPTVFSPLILDDHVIAMKAKDAFASGAGWVGFLNDCFVFAKPDSGTTSAVAERLFGAWWAPPEYRFAFWRPVSAGTHLLDQLLWPGNSVAMHLHNLAWFVALLFALNRLYRRFLSPRIASLALALYAWDDARGFVLAWVANRNALVAGVFGICTLIAHDRWRRDRWRTGAWLAPMLFAVDLLSAEMSVASFAYLLGHALFLERGSIGRRILPLLPYLAILMAWQAVYVAAGYGIEGSGIYIQPLQEPLRYAMKLFERAPILLLGQLTPIDSSFWGMLPFAMKTVVFLAALAVGFVVGQVVWARVARDPQVRFWLVGATLSLAPISATGPADRNLVFVGLGISAVLAMLFVNLVDTAASARWPRFVAAALAVCNLVLAPVLLPAKCLSILAEQAFFAPVDRAIPRDEAIKGKTLVVVWVGTEVSLYSSVASREAQGVPRPGKLRTLALSADPVSVARLDDLTLRLRPGDGFFASEMQQLLRSPSRPFRQGEVVRLSDMTATIIELTQDKRPQTVDFRFASPLESSMWLWMRDTGHGLVAWTPPGIGQTVLVPAGR